MVARVAFPMAIPGLYDYHVPRHLEKVLVPGTPVRVPLRTRRVWGVVVAIVPRSKIRELKDILDARTSHWTDKSRSLIKLYEWMAAYYHCGLGRVFRPLVRKGVVDLGAKKEAVYTVAGVDTGSLSPRQRESAARLAGETGVLTKQQLAGRFGFSDHMIRALTNAGVLTRTCRKVLREPDELRHETSDERVRLTDEQEDAVRRIRRSFGGPSKPFLVYGITGSGKTHVYIEIARTCLEQGRCVIILVPEISLTPQTIRRFRDALGNTIAVVHSRMSDGERRDSLEEIVSGRKKVAIGVRSAVLAPMENVGLIVVDEEHDQSYKQGDLEPRYNARDVAVMRGHFQNAVVVLGSATPSFESFHNALSGKYEMIRLARRFGEASLPRVELVDMNQEHRRGNWTFLSTYLRERIGDTLAGDRQVILLLNRRGFSVSLICKNCGHTYTCPNCSVHLVYHRAGAILRCHQCGHSQHAPDTCPRCRGDQIKYAGTGIQKAEEHLREVFPAARILRMDQDTTRGKGKHVSILGTFADRKADILLGTQMVAKGLDFPGVQLVGVLQADIGLHFPDFRASERTFQLLAQVAGRAGRKDSLGEVVVQTYMPEEPGIQATRSHDYEGFFAHEIDARKGLQYPPFSRLGRVIVQGESERAVKSLAEKLARALRKAGGDGVTVLGPSPAVLARVKRAYRHACLVKAGSPRMLQAVLDAVRQGASKAPPGVKVTIDVDPLDML
ncbi:MAG: primosomal protein N' [Chitinivibrionales bacterium]|nr:primosomal protein N' [Chitinivibrionales bacterium]MBD3396346.1 primosomal protein N' [Chitinivibrionales bacterium]